MMGSGRLPSKIAIVTGAADGIGRAIATRFVAEGAAVLAVDLSIEKLQAGLGAETTQLRLLAQDVTAPQAAKLIVATALAVFGGLDILVNNAGVVQFEPTEVMSDDTWRRTIDVNLRASFELCRAAIPLLRQRGGGRIVNLSSINAFRTTTGLAAYASAKAGIVGLTQTLAIELGPDQITANYVVPGVIATGMTKPLLEANPEALANFSPLGRVGRPEDIANAVLFLASDEASFVSGHGLVVDGGFLPKL
jgi:NAD(P)-dependent dehydrogenase (short-subunit alcohol dehydrogenase family)